MGTCKGQLGRWKEDDLARWWKLARADSDDGRKILQDSGPNLEGRRSCKTVGTYKAMVDVIVQYIATCYTSEWVLQALVLTQTMERLQYQIAQ